SHARRHRRRLAAAGLHVRPGRHADLSDVVGFVGVFPGGPLHTRVAGAHHPGGRRHHLLHRPHLLPPDGAVRAPAGRGQAAHLRQRRRGPAGRHPATLEAGHWHRDDGRHRRHGDVPHLHLVGRRRRAAGRHRQGRAGLPGAGGGRRRPRSAARHGRKAGRDRPYGLPLPRRSAPGQLRQGRLELPGRRLRAGRRRLLLLPGTGRRHDHHGGLQRGRPGSRGRPAAPPCGGRMRRHRQAGRGARHDRQGLLRAQARARARRSDDAPAAGPRQIDDRTLQVPARDRVREQPAAHRNRQAPALQAAPGAAIPGGRRGL
ncbi:MAG: Acyl-coenzyme A synthetases/AMP-(fatty) acid ligases, partial [uncultured Ramlibacter sp.]